VKADLWEFLLVLESCLITVTLHAQSMRKLSLVLSALPSLTIDQLINTSSLSSISGLFVYNLLCYPQSNAIDQIDSYGLSGHQGYN